MSNQTNNNGPLDLSRTPIHIQDAHAQQAGAIVLTDFTFDGPGFQGYIEQHCNDDHPGRLMMVESTPVDWATWEMHPHGEEIVFVLSGKGEFIQQIDGEEQRIPVSAGVCLVNPAGVWHSADVEEPITAIYVTPCPGTNHKPRESA